MSSIRLNAAKFIAEVTDFEQSTLRTAYRRFIRSSVMTMVTVAVDRSPVRSGLLRGSWFVSLGRPDLSTRGREDPDGVFTIQRAGRSLAGNFNPYQNIYITNTAKHASFINYGTDKIEPQYMLEIAKDQFERIIGE